MWLCCLLSLCLVLCRECVGFNLEPRIPVIKKGVRGTYFGYSVAQHQSVDDIRGDVRGNWLLVGAPLGQNRQPGTNRSGALFKCPITSWTDDCDQVITDGKKNPLDGLYDKYINNNDLTPPLDDEIKDGQWLGVTVRSQGKGKKAMVCAHRYIQKGKDYQWGQGLCHTLTQDLDYDETWEPCQGRPTNRAHEQFGYCQAGTNAILLDDDTALIGTPGPYTWRGTVFVVSVSDNFLLRDKTFYYGPFLESESPVDKYSYLGMAVTSGRFFGNQMSYAAGAPRSNGTGQVIFFSKVRSGESKMVVKLILSGEVFASSFGYELNSADLNSDDIPDLLVGAPFYYSDNEGGAVYIYYSPPQGLNASSPYVRLTGKPESRFGFAIGNLGDLNKDGYNDIAIGAPYDGNGAVFIYLGSKDGLITEPSQVLRAEQIPGQIPVTFGYSLNGGLDLDENSYPDLLVGAYDTDQVMLIRSRPIINITTTVGPAENLTNINATSKECKMNASSTEVCFGFEACFDIKDKPRHGAAVKLEYQIEAETFTGKKFSRVYFANGIPGKNHIVNERIELKRRESGACMSEIVYLKNVTEDIQSPIKFKLTYRLLQREPILPTPGQRLPNIDDFPILDQQEASKVFEATFEKDCAENDICESDLNVYARWNLTKENGQYIVILGTHKEVKLDITVRNDGEPAYEANLYIFYPPTVTYNTYSSQGTTFSCTSCNNTNYIVFSLGNPFRYGEGFLEVKFLTDGLEDIESKIEFVILANSTSEEIHKQDDLVLEALVIKRAEVALEGKHYPPQVRYGQAVKGESAMEYLDEIGPRIQHNYVVYNHGPWKASIVNVFIYWPFQVENKRKQGKWLLYLTHMPVVDGDGECYIHDPAAMPNPLNLTARPGLAEPPLEPPAQLQARESSTESASLEMEEIHARYKRDAEYVILAEAVVDQDGKKKRAVIMSCERGTAKCIHVQCIIRNLLPRQEAIIRMHSRLWDATLVEDYPKVDWVSIQSKAHIEIPAELEIRQNTTNDYHMEATYAYPLLDQREPEPVPIWIIIVSAVAGILLLVLLIAILYKFGFFKRKRPDPTLTGNLEKHRGNGDYNS